MDKFPKTDKFAENLDKIKKDARAFNFLENIWKTKELYIGGVIDYNSGVSNGIKVFSQSIFSHTNFFNPADFTTYGSENLLGVISRDYQVEKNGRFHYVVRKINLDYLATIMSLEYIESVFEKIGKISKDEKGKMLKYFTSYSKFRESGENPDFENAVSLDLGNIKFARKDSDKIEKFLEDKRGLKYGKPISMKESDFSRYFSYLKEFLILGVVKNMLKNYAKKYDLAGAILTASTPWEKIIMGTQDMFCSEFVAEALFYSGFYPFDIGVKDPRSVTPGDIMDISIIFESLSEKLYLIDDSGTQNDFIKDLSEDYTSSNKFLKNYIIGKEENEGYFVEQKSLIEKIDKTINFLSGISGKIF